MVLFGIVAQTQHHTHEQIWNLKDWAWHLRVLTYNKYSQNPLALGIALVPSITVKQAFKIY